MPEPPVGREVGAGVAIAADNAALGAEGLDGLVVHQGVDGEAGGFAVRLVQGPPVLDAPVGDREGEDEIDDDGGDRRVSGEQATQQPASTSRIGQFADDFDYSRRPGSPTGVRVHHGRPKREEQLHDRDAAVSGRK